MIAFPNDLPLIRIDTGEAIPFEPEWLMCSLTRAARRAGLPQWWLAPHVTASVTEFLRADHDAPMIEATRLEQAVQTVLQVIGYAEVGRHFIVGRPVVAISLVDLVREAGTGYELAFFELLGRRLADALATRTPHFQLTGLWRCVKLLSARKAWSRDCEALQSEIVAFARTQTEHAVAEQDVTFSLT
ncbi:MAG: hypothetical protein ABMA13_08275 [Chthoniobacteraceae bacterium]